MTDLESRVREALDSAADSAPPAAGLAEAARRRRRGHQRRSVALTSVAVAAVLVAGVAGVRSLQETSVVPVPDRVAPGDATSAVPSPEPDPAPAPEGWRTVSWRGVSVQVPEGWAAGSRTDWCAERSGPEVPVVERPRTPAQLVSCPHPGASLGLSLGSAAAYDPVYPSGHVWRYQHGDSRDGVKVYVDGSWLGHFYDDRHLVQVNAADRDTVERILATVEVSGAGPALVWHEVAHDGVTVAVPPMWAELDASGCEFEVRTFGPPDRDPCGDGAGLAFYGSATFDPAHGPGVVRDQRSGTWGGYVYAGDYAVWVADQDRALVERVLDSARESG